MVSGRKLLAAASCGALLLGACSADLLGGAPGSEPAPAEVNIIRSDQPPPRSSTAEMVSRVLPSVVNVRVRSLQLDEFGAIRQGRGEGSGVIIDRNGTILTNAHVVRDAVEVTVAFNDDHDPMEGRVVGAVVDRDLAVIRVAADDLEAITIGRSQAPQLRLGDPVVAIGFPLGLGPTVTKGIVSGRDRSIPVAEGLTGTEVLEGLLQTDAAINPGNSGGALVNAAGQLVGINTAAAQAGAAENVGFAIAIDSALPVIEQILSSPRTEQAWLGVQVTTVDEIIASQLGLPLDTRGAAVVGVVGGSPAQQAGIERGDVIVAIDGAGIQSDADLTSALAEHEPGDRVSVELLDAGGRRTVTVRVDARPPAFTP